MNHKYIFISLRYLIGVIFFVFCLFWLMFSLMGVFSVKFMLPFGQFELALLSLWGILSLIAKVNMFSSSVPIDLDPNNKGKSAAISVGMWIFIFVMVLRNLLPSMVVALTAFPVWYIVCTILFFVVSPVIDLAEMITSISRK